MGWWVNKPGGTTVNLDDGYDETQGKMSDVAWSGAGDGTIVSILKKLAAAGGGSAVTMADGADVAQGTTTDVAGTNTVIGKLKSIAAALAGKLLVTADPITFASPQHIIVDTSPVQISDNAGSLTVDAPVATPVFTRLSNGAVAIDILPVSGPLTDTQLRASAVPVSGTVTAGQGVANATPWNENIAQVGGVAVIADATFKSMRVTDRPPEFVGVFGMAGDTGGYTVTTANSPLVALRNPSATTLIIVTKIIVPSVFVVAFTTAGAVQRELVVGRGWTVSDTGTAITPSKRRASLAASIADAKFGAPLTAGTRTLDAQPIARTSKQQMTAAAQTVIPYTVLYDINRDSYDIILVQNEGVLLRFAAAETASTRESHWQFEWGEALSY